MKNNGKVNLQIKGTIHNKKKTDILLVKCYMFLLLKVFQFLKEAKKACFRLLFVCKQQF